MLYRPYYLSGTKTARTNINTLGAAVHHGFYFFYVRAPAPVGMPVGVADFASRLAFFAANIANSCHKKHLLLVEWGHSASAQGQWTHFYQQLVYLFSADRLADGIKTYLF